MRAYKRLEVRLSKPDERSLVQLLRSGVQHNLNIHCRKSLTDYYGEIPGAHLWNRFTVHYTPKHGSWLNQAEIEISLFSHQCLGPRRLPSLACLRTEARAWNVALV